MENPGVHFVWMFLCFFCLCVFCSLFCFYSADSSCEVAFFGDSVFDCLFDNIAKIIIFLCWSRCHDDNLKSWVENFMSMNCNAPSRTPTCRSNRKIMTLGVAQSSHSPAQDSQDAALSDTRIHEGDIVAGPLSQIWSPIFHLPLHPVNHDTQAFISKLQSGCPLPRTAVEGMSGKDA